MAILKVRMPHTVNSGWRCIDPMRAHAVAIRRRAMVLLGVAGPGYAELSSKKASEFRGSFNRTLQTVGLGLTLNRPQGLVTLGGGEAARHNSLC
jgi:hypothetical protein